MSPQVLVPLLQWSLLILGGFLLGIVLTTRGRTRGSYNFGLIRGVFVIEKLSLLEDRLPSVGLKPQGHWWPETARALRASRALRVVGR